MAQNKTVATDASVEAFLAAVPDPRRRADGQAVARLMQEVTGHEPRMWGPSIVGFGRCRYRYETGREGEMGLAGFSPRKGALVLYIMGGFERYEELLARLGRHKTGKVCLYINKLADVDQDVLRELVRESVAHVTRMHEVVAG